MKFHRLVETSSLIAGRSARNRKVEILKLWLDELTKNEDAERIPAAVSILSGKLPYGKIGIGWARISQGLISEGLADEIRDAQHALPPTLELQEVLEAFRNIKATTGKGSTARKIELLENLFERAAEDERRFLIGVLMQDLRQGALEGVMLDAVAQATELPLTRLRRAAMLAGSVFEASKTALLEGAEGLDRYRLEVFRPLQPMLAQPAADLEEAWEEHAKTSGRVLIDTKIDGARIQVHRDGSSVRVYSRRLRDVTESVPEVVAAALTLEDKSAAPSTATRPQRMILDGEVFAVREDDSAHAFQDTMRRFGRSKNTEALTEILPLRPLWFDLMLLGDRELIDEPLSLRRELLESISQPGQCIPAQLYDLDPDAFNQASSFVEQQLEAGHEGVMVKALDSPYAAGKRGKAWFKVKPVHTLDLVVLAAEWGHGRRRGWLSNLHLGARSSDEPNSGFVMLGKTFKGLTDKVLVWQTEQLLARETNREGIVVHVRPELVVEIAFNDVQRSPQYPGGVALRFARVRNYREDKHADEADTLEAVLAIHNKQNTTPSD